MNRQTAAPRADDDRIWIPDGDAPRLPRKRAQYVAGPVKVWRFLGARLIVADLYTGPEQP